MRVPKPLKSIIGGAAVWPVVYLILFLSDRLDGLASVWSTGLTAVHLATTLLALGLWGYCLEWLFRSQTLSPGRKALWATALILGGLVATPLFFWLYVWPAEDESGT